MNAKRGVASVPLGVVGLIVFLGNVPFGYWRSNVAKFSLQWFLAVHLPVPGVILFRLYAGLGWALITYPVLVGAFFLGQLAGGYLKRRLLRSVPYGTSSCLVWDAVGALRGAVRAVRERDN